MDPHHQSQYQHNPNDPYHTQSQEGQVTPGYGYGIPDHSQQNGFAGYLHHNDSTPAFSAAWGSESMIDPQIQAGFHTQHQNHWQQNSNPLNLSQAHQSQNQSLNSQYHDSPFQAQQQSYGGGYPSLESHQFQSYNNAAFNSPLPYGTEEPLLGTLSLGGLNVVPYQPPNNRGQTISPQALQSYPEPHFATFESPSTTNPIQQQQKQASAPTKRASMTQTPAGPIYNKEYASQILKRLPAGREKKDFLVRDAEELMKATSSYQLTAGTFLGREPIFLTDPSPIVLPKLQERRSAKEIFESGGTVKGKAWTLAQRQALKKLKLPTTKSTTTTSHGSPSADDVSLIPSSADVSDDESEYESEEDEDASDVSPLPAVRPTEPNQATEYDVIKAVWAKKSESLDAQSIRSALGTYWNIMKEIRDSWKAEYKAFEDAEKAGKREDAEKRREKMDSQRALFDRAIQLTLQHGNNDIVSSLGTIPHLLLAFYQFIADRFQKNQFNSPLIKHILEFIVRCPTIDTALLEKTKLDKAFAKLLKRDDKEIESLVQKALDNAKKAASKPKATETNGTSKSTTPAPVKAETGRAKLDAIAAAKKPQDATKKPAAPTSNGSSNAVKKESTTALKPSATSSKVGTTAKPGTKGGAVPEKVAPKVKVNQVVTKPTSFFSGLHSASKKPGTSIKAPTPTDAKPATTKATESATVPSTTIAKLASTAPAAPVKKTFSFAETMAMLNKPKEQELSKPEDDRPPETEEEKKKRLRKEERRKLRVTFKTGDDLTQVRLFHHDPEEELGHDDSMIRDVGDIGSEGRMLKMHKELADEDEEDYEPPAPEEELLAWVSPSLVDFSRVDEEERARNYTQKGGYKHIESLERALQEQRELTTLIAIYTSPSEIPMTPREPSDPFTGASSVEQSFGDPGQMVRERENKFLGGQGGANRPPAPSLAQPTGTPDINALLAILNGQQQAAQAPPPPKPAPAPVSGLEAIFAQFAKPQPQPQAPPPPQLYPGIDPNLQAALAAFSNPQMQQQHQAPMMQPTAPPPQQQTPDLSAILAQFAQGGIANYGQPQQQAHQQGYQQQENRKRQYDEEDGQHDGARKNKKYNGVPTKPCKFYQEGKCRKGDACTYLHSM